MHTLNRLNKFGLLKLNDELRLQESKLIWKWNQNKLPNSLSMILSERQDNLRGRRFNYQRNWKSGSISKRIAIRANSSINELSLIRTKSSLTKKIKKQIINSYSYFCRQRNCFVCGNRTPGTT